MINVTVKIIFLGLGVQINQSIYNFTLLQTNQYKV
jgi:hypothetical protein